MAIHNRIDWPVEQMRYWIEEMGMKHREVAEQLGQTTKNVSKACLRHGIQSQSRGPRPGGGHPNWNGGVVIDKDGYVRVYSPNHPTVLARKAPKGRRKGNPYVLQHRLVMEEALGRFLRPDEVVHHKNGDKKDNRLVNLKWFPSNGDHLRHELTGRCPNWTDDGKARIRAGVAKSHDTRRRRKALGETQRRGNPVRPKG